jgi:UDP-N-acetylmuramoyl-tripeptide--D-alanyl-D-alanine ligase
VLKTEGNMNNELGLPLTLLRFNRNHEAAVIEVGTNHFGEVDRLCRIAEPQFGLLTNIGKEHLEFLRDLKGVAKAEGELVNYLQSKFGTMFLNTDDKYLKPMARKKNVKFFSYGSGGKADVKGKLNGYKGFYPEIEVKYKNIKITSQLNTIGYQSYLAALSAAAVGLYFGLRVSQIKEALSEYRLDSTKRNQLKNINGAWVIDDTYNSNPGSVKPALENLRAFRIKGRKFVVLADMLELGRSSTKEHREIGSLVKKLKFENLCTYGKESYQTFLAAKGVKNNYHFQDKKTLSEFLKLNLKKGDTALVKGSRSMKMEEVIESLSK